MQAGPGTLVRAFAESQSHRAQSFGMPRFNGLVLPHQRHLKWDALDWVEQALMILCGLMIAGFCVLVLGDIVTRLIGRPWLWVQEVTMFLFIYGIFFGVAAAVRRNDHLYLAAIAESLTGRARLFFELLNRAVVLAIALCMSYFGWLNVLDGFKSLRMPSMTPMAYYYASIPLCGALVALFTIEQIVNGWRNGFERREAIERSTP
jgi:TRAP-type C4-dicarboxylate transport system permease small subunit